MYKRIDAMIIMENSVRKLRVIKALSNWAIPGMFEEVASPKTNVLQTIELHLPSEAYILGAAMNEEDDILAATSTDGILYFYKYSQQI